MVISVRIRYALMKGSFNKIRMLVIGLGSQSLSDHIPAILRNDDIELVAVYDSETAAIDKFRKLFPNLNGIPNIANLNDLSGIDAAMVIVPHAGYFKIVKLLCEKGIRIFKEKPLARNLKEVESFMRLPDFEKLCFICTQRRFNKLYIKAKKSLSNIGIPYLFSAEYKLNITDPDNGWRGDTNLAGGGCVLDMGYHIIDQLIWWFGTPKKIFAATSCLAVEDRSKYAEDSATIAFQYENGMHGNILLSRSAGEKVEKYTIFGSRGFITGNKKLLLIKNRKGETLEEIKLEDDNDMLDEQLGFFVKTINKDGNFREIISRNIRNLEFIDKCYKSI